MLVPQRGSSSGGPVACRSVWDHGQHDLPVLYMISEVNSDGDSAAEQMLLVTWGLWEGCNKHRGVVLSTF